MNRALIEGLNNARPCVINEEVNEGYEAFDKSSKGRNVHVGKNGKEQYISKGNKSNVNNHKPVEGHSTNLTKNTSTSHSSIPSLGSSVYVRGDDGKFGHKYTGDKATAKSIARHYSKNEEVENEELTSPRVPNMKKKGDSRNVSPSSGKVPTKGFTTVEEMDEKINNAAMRLLSQNEEVDEGGGSRASKSARQSASQHATLNKELKKHGDSADMVGDDGTGTKSLDVQTMKGKYANADRRGKVHVYESNEEVDENWAEDAEEHYNDKSRYSEKTRRAAARLAKKTSDEVKNGRVKADTVVDVDKNK